MNSFNIADLNCKGARAINGVIAMPPRHSNAVPAFWPPLSCEDRGHIRASAIGLATGGTEGAALALSRTSEPSSRVRA